MEKRTKLIGLRFKDQRGYTLLEYCAGAAIIAGVVWGALNMLGGNMASFLNALGGWVSDRTTAISQNSNNSN